MVYNFETFLALGIVGTADIHERLELTLGMVTEEGKDGDDSRGGDVKGEFVLEDRELLDELGKTLGKIGAECMQRLCCLSVFCGRNVGRSRFCEGRS